MKTIFLTISFFSFTLINIYSQNLEWAHSFGSSSGWDRGHQITTDAYGNVYITGQFEWTVDFDPGTETYNLTSNGDYDICIQKLDAYGNFLWARNVGGNSWDMGYSIAIDATGNSYTTGYFSETVDFDPGPGTYELSSNLGSDAFILKLDSEGDFIWARNIGDTSSISGYSTITDQDNIYLTGHYMGTVDFDPGPGTYELTSNGTQDIYILKLNSDGNFIWAKSIGGNSYDGGYSITVDSYGNTYTTGFFGETVDFDPSNGIYELTSNGGSDIYILKLNTDGDFVWAESVGGNGGDHGESITKDGVGNIYASGIFNETVDFDPGNGIYELTSNGIHDVFVLKLSNAGEFIWAKSFGESSVDVGHSISTDVNGSVYTSGYYYNTIDFDPGPGIYEITSSGNADSFIQKMQSNGEFEWAISIGGAAGDYINSITLDTSGNIFATGHYYGIADFDPGPGVYELTPNGIDDIFVFKLSNILSIEEALVNKNPLFYPNPAESTLYINKKNETISKIVLYSMSGIEIIKSDDDKIDISQLPVGIYLIKVQKENGKIQTEKIIKL